MQEIHTTITLSQHKKPTTNFRDVATEMFSQIGNDSSE